MFFHNHTSSKSHTTSLRGRILLLKLSDYLPNAGKNLQLCPMHVVRWPRGSRYHWHSKFVEVKVVLAAVKRQKDVLILDFVATAEALTEAKCEDVLAIWCRALNKILELSRYDRAVWRAFIGRDCPYSQSWTASLSSVKLLMTIDPQIKVVAVIRFKNK